MGKLLHPDTINPRSLVWVDLVSVSRGLIHSLPPNRLGTGERAVIAYAQAHRGYVAGMDDLRARQLAEAIGLKVTGTLETLLRAKQSGLTPAVKPLVDDVAADANATVGLRFYLLSHCRTPKVRSSRVSALISSSVS